jgi:hypothetical protein
LNLSAHENSLAASFSHLVKMHLLPLLDQEFKVKDVDIIDEQVEEIITVWLLIKLGNIDPALFKSQRYFSSKMRKAQR